MENMEKTLEIKQSEYSFLLDSKDQEIKFLQDEILKMNETMEVVKRDRLRDQKVINDYENELNHLTSRVQEIGDKTSESTLKDGNVKLEKKVAPAKMTVQKIIKKFERTFDLQDKNNAKMLSNITKNIK
jgi:phage shock protein A